MAKKNAGPANPAREPNDQAAAERERERVERIMERVDAPGWMPQVENADGTFEPCSIVAGYLRKVARNGAQYIRCHRSLRFDSYVDVSPADVIHVDARGNEDLSFQRMLVRLSAVVLLQGPGMKAPIARTLVELLPRASASTSGRWGRRFGGYEPDTVNPPCPVPDTWEEPECGEPLDPRVTLNSECIPIQPTVWPDDPNCPMDFGRYFGRPWVGEQFYGPARPGSFEGPGRPRPR